MQCDVELCSMPGIRCMMVRCICRVLLKNRWFSEDLYSLLDIQKCGQSGEAWQIEAVWLGI